MIVITIWKPGLSLAIYNGFLFAMLREKFHRKLHRVTLALGNMCVFKVVVCQWPPFGTNFPKRDNSYAMRGVEKYHSTVNLIKSCLVLEN